MAARLTNRERAQLASRYEVWKSVVLVQRWWRRERGYHSSVDPKTIKTCHSKLMTTGSVNDAPRSGRPSLSTTEDIELVRETFDKSPNKSTRQASRETGLSRHAVRTILKDELHYRPWKPHYCQKISPEDCDRRMEFGELMLSWQEDWPELFHNILWSDEAVFHVGGFVNRHNCHYWAHEDPAVIAEKTQSRPKVTVWCGMTSSRIVGPFCIRDTMNADRYLSLLRDQVWPIISTWENFNELLFMQDGAPPHFARSVRAWLDDQMAGRWIGRRGSYDWPARSPDLTPCDFLWGWAKEEVYRSKPSNLDELEARILHVLTNVPPKFLQKTVEDIPKRLQRLVENNGGYIEF